MIRGQRYEPVPQRPREAPIILDSIHNSSSYNYNSGVPTSVTGSTYSHSRTRTPSIITPSIPSSPPPSFHTHSSPGTPRPTSTHPSHPTYAELWGVAPSTSGETEHTIATSNDALATIASLKARVESLEETIGRLLLEKDTAQDDHTGRNNCCVTFSDASPDLERALMRGEGSNCCVTFSSHNKDSKRERKQAIVAGMVTLFFVCFLVTVILTAMHRNTNLALRKAQTQTEMQ